MKVPKAKLDALTGARGIAAWYVVIYHIRKAMSPYLPDAWMHFFAKGYLAVDLFFILSGFVIWLNYAPKFELDGLTAVPDFLLRRLARIYPLHFVILSAMLLFVAMLAATGRIDPSHYPINELPLHFLLLQHWGFTEHIRWNEPAWSISTEFAAYLCLPFGAAFLTKLKRAIWLDLLAIVLLCVGLRFYFTSQNADMLGAAISHFGLVRCLTEFFIGTLICSVWNQATASQKPWLDGFAAVTALLTFGLYSTNIIGELAAMPAFLSCLVFLLARSSTWQNNPLTSRLFMRLGDVSYSTYLVHFFLWIIFKFLFVSDPRNVSPIIIAGFILLTYATSELLYRLVENPGRHWVQTLAKHVPFFARAMPAAHRD